VAGARFAGGDRTYKISSNKIARVFGWRAMRGISTEPQVLYLLENEVDVFIYQGVPDFARNTAGNWKWASNILWKGQPEFMSRTCYLSI
jgi:cathepsin A (carboxypeptidase C)